MWLHRCYNREMVSIPFCNEETDVDAFRKGLFPNRELYKLLTKFNCTTMEDVLAQVWVEIRWEEDELHHGSRSSYDNRGEERCNKRPFQPFDWQITSYSIEPYPKDRRELFQDKKCPLDGPIAKLIERLDALADRTSIP